MTSPSYIEAVEKSIDQQDDKSIRIRELEAKLDKAVEAISRASLQLFWCGWAARKISKELDTVLAELEK
jgi:hypothetical protein